MWGRFWNFLGHVFRIKTIGDLLGWWTTDAWQKALAACGGMIVFGISHYLHAPLWALPLILLFAAAILLWVFSKVSKLRLPANQGAHHDDPDNQSATAIRSIGEISRGATVVTGVQVTQSSGVYAAGRDVVVSHAKERSRPRAAITCLPDNQRSGTYIFKAKITEATATRLHIDPITIPMSQQIIDSHKAMHAAFPNASQQSELPTFWVVEFAEVYEIENGGERHIDYTIRNIGTLQLRDLDFVLQNALVAERYVEYPVKLQFSDEDGKEQFQRIYILSYDRYANKTVLRLG